MFFEIFVIVAAVTCALGMAGMYNLMRISRRELNLLHVQSEAIEFMIIKDSYSMQSRSCEARSYNYARDITTLWTCCITGWRSANSWVPWRMCMRWSRSFTQEDRNWRRCNT